MGLEAIVSQAVMVRLGWALLQFVWQGALVAALTWGALVLLRRHSANARYVAACAGLLAMVILPVASFCLSSGAGGRPGGEPVAHRVDVPGAAFQRADPASRTPAVTRPARPLPVAGHAPAAVPESAPRWSAWRGIPLSRAVPWVAFVWLVGVLVLAVRLSGGWALCQYLRQVGVRPVPEWLAARLVELAASVSVARPVRLLESTLARVPVVIGWLRPVILVPASVLTGLPPAQLEAILAHELAHVRRHDYLVNLLQSLVEVVLFYHPAVWWLSARIRAEREHCCDDLVADLSTDRLTYARALMELATLNGGAARLAPAATGGCLLARIRRLVTPAPRHDRAGAWLAGIVALALPALLLPMLIAARPALAQPAGNAITRPGVELTYEDGVDETNLEAIADVVHVAKQAFDALFPELAQPQIHVHVWDATQAYWEGVITDRLSTIYIGLGPHGMGEDFRPDACPVGILCQAVAELHNPTRLPGFDRFVAQRCLAPAVAKALGATPLPHTRLNPESDDVTGRLAVITASEYTAVHPDYAAVAALLDIERLVGLPTLKELLLPALASERDPFGAFRTAALAGEPALADAFTAYDQATRLPVGEDGTCLIASFEPDEGVTTSSSFMPVATQTELPLVISNLFQASFTDEWATDGRQSLKLQATQTRPTLGLILSDPDWRYRDWTQFRQFRMDLRYEGPAPAEVYAYVADDVGRGHATLGLTGGMMQPGGVRNVSLDLTDELLTKGRPRPGGYYDGAFRAHEVAALQITVANPPGPFTLYVDNLRLAPRVVPAATEAPAATPAEAPDLAARRAQAATLLEQAVALKREGKPAEAEEQLRKALALNAGDPQVHRVLAWTLMDLNRKAEAVAEFRTVLELNPGPDVRAEVEAALRKLE